MICYVLAMGKQHLGPHVVVGYGIKIFWPGLFITSPDHLARASIAKETLSASQLSSHKSLEPSSSMTISGAIRRNLVEVMSHNFIYGTPSYSQDRNIALLG